MKTAFRSTALAILLLAITGLSDAQAACTSPDGGAGNITWNGVDAVIWCDGTTWHSLADSGGGASSGTAGYIQFSAGAGVFDHDSTSGGQLFWDATNHRLGIGLTAPTTALEINGAARISGGVGIGIAPNTTYPLYLYANQAAAIGARVQNANAANGAAARFYVTADTADGGMTVYSSGTTGSWGGVPLANRFFFNQSSTGSGISFSANGAAANVTFHTGGSLERMRIESNGNVGIGAAVPGNKLEITQGTTGNSGLRFTNLTSASTAGASNGKALSVNANGDVVLVDAATGSATPAGTVAGAVQFRGATAVLAADDVNLIWADTNNRLGIGTATPAYALDVAGFINTNAASGYKQDGNTILRTTPGPGAQGVLIGHQAGANLATFATGHADVFIGRNAGAACVNCTTSVAIGFNAMTATVGKPGGAELTDHADTTNNVAIGAYAMGATTGYPQHAVAIGYGSQSTVGNTKYNVSVGYQAMETTTPGDSNVAIGAKTLRTGSGQDYSTAIGWLALTGASGDHNTCVGAFCLQAASSGIRNTAIGTLAGDTISTGSYNLMLGYNTVPNISPSSSYQINIGNAIYGYNGKIGIGALNPGNKFEITHGTAGNSGLRFTDLTSASTAAAANGKALSLNATGDVILVDAATGSATAAGSAGQVQFNNGSNVFAADAGLTWDNTNKRLGIGTAAPVQPLHVLGTGAIGARIQGTTYSYLNLFTTNSSAVLGLGDNGAMYLTTYQALPIVFNTTSAERMRISAAGDVGIGTISPSAKVEINTVGANTSPLVIRTNASAGNYTPTNSAIIVKDAAGAEILRLFGSDPDVTNNYNSGNLFVGASAGQNHPTDNATAGYQNSGLGFQALRDNTTGYRNTGVGYQALLTNTTGQANTALGGKSLTANLVGNYSTALGFQALSLATASSNTGTGSWALADLTTGADNTALGANTGRGITTGRANTILGAAVTGLDPALSNNIIIADGDGNRRINVDAAGSVGLGTTTNTAAAGRLNILFDSNTQQGVSIKTSSTSNSGHFARFVNSSDALIGGISLNGAGVTYNTTSDRRLKENIVPTARGIDTLMKIEIDDFNFIADDRQEKVQGFIAQQLNELYPEAVTVGGDDAATQPWSVDYGRVTPLIIKAVQDLKAENDNLRAALTAANDNNAEQNEAIDELRREIDALKAAR